MSALRRVLGLFLVAFLAFGAPLHVAAQGSDAERAAALGEEGTSFFRQGQFAEAVERFQAAYELDPHPVLLFNLGRARQELGQLAAARDTFSLVIAIADDPGVQAAAQSRIEAVNNLLIAQGYDPATVTAANYVQRGNLTITTTPEGAAIFLDGQRRGTTPLTLANLDVATYELRIALDDYHPVTATIEFRGGTDTLRLFTLQQRTSLEEYVPPQPGYLSVVSPAIGAEVFLDGDAVGTTPVLEYGLAPGTYIVAVRHPDFAPYSTTVQVMSANESRVVATMTRTRGHEPDPGETRRTIGAGMMIGSGAALIAGGVFGVLALDSASEYRARLDDPTRGEFRDQAQTRALISDVALGVGAAAFITGAILYWTAPRATERGFDFVDGVVFAPTYDAAGRVGFGLATTF